MNRGKANDGASATATIVGMKALDLSNLGNHSNNQNRPRQVQAPPLRNPQVTRPIVRNIVPYVHRNPVENARHLLGSRSFQSLRLNNSNRIVKKKAKKAKLPSIYDKFLNGDISCVFDDGTDGLPSSVLGAIFMNLVANKALVGGTQCLRYELSNSSLKPGNLLELPKHCNSFPYSNTYYVAQQQQHHRSKEVDDDLAQFKCTFRQCGKRISTNVNFVYHIWAHVVDQEPWKQYSDLMVHFNFLEPETSGGLFQTPMKEEVFCPECLTVFPNAMKMLEHFIRLHKSGPCKNSATLWCHVCEREVDEVEVDVHANAHGNADLPYHCVPCQFRTSSRKALFLHYEKFHNNTTLLICPFCLLQFNIKRGTTKGRRTLIADGFIKHMVNHAEHSQAKAKCRRCACRFMAPTSKELHTLLEEHRANHNPVRFGATSASLFALTKEVSRCRLLKSESAPIECPDCLCHVKTVEKHFKESKFCSNDGCNYSTSCPTGHRHHKFLCPKGAHLSKRLPFGQPNLRKETRLSVSTRNSNFKCTRNCGFTAENTQSIVKHVTRHCVGANFMKISRLKANEPVPLAEMNDFQKEHVNLFGLHSSSIHTRKEALPLKKDDLLAQDFKFLKNLPITFKAKKTLREFKEERVQKNSFNRLVAVHEGKVDLKKVAQNILKCKRAK